MSDESQLATLRLLNTEIKERLARQDASANVVDTKAALLGALALASAQFTASQDDLHVLYAVGAFLLFAVAAGMAVKTYAVSTVNDVPDPSEAVTLASATETELLANLIGNRVKAFERNMIRSRLKVWWWHASLVALLAGVLLAVGAVLHTG